MKKRTILLAILTVMGITFILTHVNAQDYQVVESGQLNCYDEDGNTITCPSPGDSLYGQDAQYQGPEMSFIDNGDGTISDLNTGLMWQKVPSSTTRTWQASIDYCDGLELSGYDDWRIPNLKELFSISDFNSGWPYLNTTYFTLASGMITKDEQYWTSNHYVGVTVEGGSDAAFGVNHVTGHIKAYPASAGGPIGEKYVRAVRGNAYGVNEYVDNDDGTISDNATGLMWTKDDNGEGIEWKTALAYAESSEIAGHSDWRLPNIKELQSIVDYSYSPSATDPANVGPAIDPMFNCTPIINEAGDDDYAYYWSSTSAHFDATGPYYYAWYVAFGRAVNGEGLDFHGAGGVRFDTKYEGGPLGEGGERFYNYVRLVRDIGSVGMEDNDNVSNTSVQVFPNPSSDRVIIYSENNIQYLSIFNINGLLIKEDYPAAKQAIIDVSQLSNGMYFIRILDDKGNSINKKIMKK